MIWTMEMRSIFREPQCYAQYRPLEVDIQDDIAKTSETLSASWTHLKLGFFFQDQMEHR
jgi:hypothetical protein